MPYVSKMLCCAVSDATQGVIVYDVIQGVTTGNGNITVKPGEGFALYVVLCTNPAVVTATYTISVFAVHDSKRVKVGNEFVLKKTAQIPFGDCRLFEFDLWMEEDADLHIKVEVNKPNVPAVETKFSVKVEGKGEGTGTGTGTGVGNNNQGKGIQLPNIPGVPSSVPVDVLVAGALLGALGLFALRNLAKP